MIAERGGGVARRSRATWRSSTALRGGGRRADRARYARRRSRAEGPLAGEDVVVTGTLEGYTREAIGEHLAGHGAKVTNSISGQTDYLLAGDGGGSKRAKAEKLGVPVIDLRGARHGIVAGRGLTPVRARPGQQLHDAVLQLVGGQDVHVVPVHDHRERGCGGRSRR